MSKFKIDNRTLSLLHAQVSLSETFNHTLRSAPQREALTFRLKVERSKLDTHFTVELGQDRHTLTLPISKKMHLKLADFIEEIANGPADHCSPAEPLHLSHSSRRYGIFEIEHKQRVFDLVCTGGAICLDLGFDLPIHLAIHRNKTRNAITTIMSIGTKKPRTKCFTLCGTEVEMYTMVAESLTHLAAVATPAAHAA